MVCRYLLWQTLTHIEISICCHHLMKEQTSSVPHPQADATLSARVSSQAYCRLKLWRDHFLQIEDSDTQFTRDDNHWRRSLRVPRSTTPYAAASAQPHRHARLRAHISIHTMVHTNMACRHLRAHCHANANGTPTAPTSFLASTSAPC